MKILAVILFLGIMLSSCGNKADSERLNDSAFTTTAESSVVDSDSMDVDESSQVGDESDIQGDSSEDDMKWRLFEDTYKETGCGKLCSQQGHKDRWLCEIRAGKSPCVRSNTWRNQVRRGRL